MKIICNKDEFVEIVENCVLTRVEAGTSTCDECLLRSLCSHGTEKGNGEIMDTISDICEIKEGE